MSSRYLFIERVRFEIPYDVRVTTQVVQAASGGRLNDYQAVRPVERNRRFASQRGWK